jgi:hypothetical protein
MLFRFAIGQAFSGILYAVMVLSTVAGLIFFFFTIFQCAPVSYYWNRMATQGKCLNVETLVGVVYFYSAAAAACDLTMGLLPAFLIRNLRINRRTKAGIAGILGLGCTSVFYLFLKPC